MGLNSLKEKLHTLIDASTESKLIEVYNLFEEDYTDEFKMRLEEEYTEYKENNEVIAREAIDKAVDEMLHGKSDA